WAWAKSRMQSIVTRSRRAAGSHPWPASRHLSACDPAPQPGTVAPAGGGGLGSAVTRRHLRVVTHARAPAFGLGACVLPGLALGVLRLAGGQPHGEFLGRL